MQHLPVPFIPNVFINTFKPPSNPVTCRLLLFPPALCPAERMSAGHGPWDPREDVGFRAGVTVGKQHA